MYRQVRHIKILHGDYAPFVCSQNKQRLLPYTTSTVAFITEVESVYSAVRTGSLQNTNAFRL